MSQSVITIQSGIASTLTKTTLMATLSTFAAIAAPNAMAQSNIPSNPTAVEATISAVLNRVNQPVMPAHRHLVTHTVINAPTNVVWQVLMDFKAYPTWNPFIKSIVGIPVLGHQITTVMQPHGQGESTFKPVILALDTDKHFAWKGKLLWGGLFDGTHHFELTTLPDGSTFLVQHEYFGGIWVPMMKKMLTQYTKISFDAMNLALKQRAERMTLAQR